MDEEYRQIEGYDNYSVSNLGNIRNDKTRQLLKPCLLVNGYLGVCLCKENKKKTHHIHRLIAIAFLENPDNLLEIDHINQNRTDNRIENIRWCSRGNNMRNRKKWGVTSKYIGISMDKKTNKWQAKIIINKTRKYLGCFETEEKAYAKWCETVIENNLQEFYGL
jgi:hypothetical protein